MVGWRGIAAYGGTAISNCVLWYPSHAGLFRQRDLELAMTATSGIARAVEDLIAGRVDFVFGGSSAVLEAQLQGQDLVLVGSGYNLMPFSLVGGPRLSGPEALAEATLALTGRGGAVEFALRVLCQNQGIPLEHVRLRPEFPSQRACLEAIGRGEVEGTFLAPPLLFEALNRGLREAFSFQEAGFEYPIGAVAVRREDLRARRPMVRAFLMALAEGLQQARTDREAVIRTVAAITGVEDAALLGRTYERFVAGLPAVPRLSRSALAADLAITAPGQPGVRLAELVDESVLDELAAEGWPV